MLSDTARLAVQLDMTGNLNKGAVQAQKSITGLQGRIKAIGAEAKGSILTGVGLGAGAAGFGLLSAGISTAIGFMGDAVSLASDMAETQSKLDQVFKTSAETIRAWAKTSTAGIITTEAELLSAVGSFGNFLQAMGTAESEAAAMSTRLVDVAADVASFNNSIGGSAEVLLAFQSALAGQTEPAAALGIDLLDVAVKAKLAQMGIKAVNGQFTQGQKIAARYQLILEDTATAQGDVGRTSTGLANSQRALSKTVTELQTKLGEQLLPVMTAVSNWIVTNLVPAIDLFTGGIGKAIDAMVDLRDKAAEVFGRDIVNDMSNLVRIVSTGGIVVLTDQAGNMGLAFEDAARNVDEFANGARRSTNDYAFMGRVLRATGDAARGAGEDFEDLGDGEADAADAAKKLAEAAKKTADAIQAAQDRTRRLADQAARLNDAFVTLAEQGFKETRKGAREARREIERLLKGPDRDAKSMGLLRRELTRLSKQQREAAREGRADAFAAIALRKAEVLAQMASIKVAREGMRTWREYGRTIRRIPKVVIDVSTPGASQAQATLNGLLSLTSQIGTATLPGLTSGPRPRPRGRRKDGAGGASWFPGDWGMVGERGPERIRNMGGVAVVEPMRAPQMVPIIIRTAITAHQIVERSNRVVSGARLIAS